MKSLQWRLTLWFTGSLVIVVLVLMLAADWHLDTELRREYWERTHPAQPDWIVHGSYTDQEVHDILGQLGEVWAVVAIPLIALAVFAAYLIARHSTRPVQQINQQLNRVGIDTLTKPIVAPDADPEIRELVNHLNGLLQRLQTAFTHLREFTGHVAHELRTPLQLMRLRIEANAAAMNPELAEELQEELARLSNYVQAALALAHAEQGRVEFALQSIPLRAFVADILEPFARLAESEGRTLHWTCPAWVTAWSDRDILKQMLVNLLNNALQHGTGEVHVRVRQRADKLVFVIWNKVARQPGHPSAGLGIGLRLVSALAQQLPGTSATFRRGETFCARLVVPAHDFREIPAAIPQKLKSRPLVAPGTPFPAGSDE